MAETTNRGEIVAVCKQLSREYHRGPETIQALSNVSLEVETGKLIALVGPSGSGKTTLMNLIGCLDRPTSGEVWLAGKRVDGLSPRRQVSVRRDTVGQLFYKDIAGRLFRDRRTGFFLYRV